MQLWFAVRKRARGPGRLRRPLFLLGCLGFGLGAYAQSRPAETKPYAKLDRDGVTYRGPANTSEKELPGGGATIGMIVPLNGPGQSDGRALLTAAQIALEEEQARGPLTDGSRLTLVARDESGPWGQASSEVLKLVEQDHAVVVLTSANGNTAHQADQIANKISFPILTLSSDPTTTQANVPWLFRLGPSDTDQAQAFCRRIYESLRLRNVLLIAQSDHDGRVGSAEFEKAARDWKAPPPERLEVRSSNVNLEAISATIRAENPDAIVVWTDASLAGGLIPAIREASSSTPVYLCRKAAETTPPLNSIAGLFTIGPVPAPQAVAETNFEQLYRDRTGTAVGQNAIETYEAVRLIAAGLRCVGANRVALREYFATSGKEGGSAKGLSFDPAGNSTQEYAVVGLSSKPLVASHP